MTPTFVADDPQLVTWAQALWPAAETCVGWPARTTPVVTITVADPGNDRAGRGLITNTNGLEGVQLREPDAVVTLAHELGHAWSHGGAPALAEGRADLLAECALRATGLGPPARRVIDLPALEDVVTWTDIGPSATVANGYAAGRGMALILSKVLTPAELWPKDNGLDWSEVDDRLAWHGKPGEQVLQALHHGVDAQRIALRDADQDGLPQLAEVLSGTRDDRWDTDGDGRWDGAPQFPAGVRPLPIDGRFHCLGLTGPATLSWSGAGPEHVLRTGTTDLGWGAQSPVDGPITVAVTPAGAGGVWVRVQGGTASTDGCLERPRFTLVQRPGAVAVLPVVADNIGRAVQQATKLGLVVVPFSVELTSESGLQFEGRRARIWADWAVREGTAQVLVATFALDGLSSQSFGAQLALARELGAPADSLVGWDGATETALWTAAVARCRTRWKGLLDGTCAVP